MQNECPRPRRWSIKLVLITLIPVAQGFEPSHSPKTLATISRRKRLEEVAV